jgi:hypothetical protein
MKYLTLALVLAGLYACSPNPLYVPPVKRIDWATMPAEAYKPAPLHTQNELAFKRERARMYAALQFERQRPAK